MPFRLTLACSLLLFAFASFAQPQPPNEFLGYALGDRFTSHHRVVDYFEHVAAQVPNVQLRYYGETYEHRPLLVAYVASPENSAKLDDIRRANLTRTGLVDSATGSFDDIAIVWLSYNVHGNEAVSTEAVMGVLYELANPDNTRAQEWLKNTVVILDPCINPDGRDRYATWYNQHVNTPSNPSPDSWEHHEPWPGGRPNHYFFDLNRDWAWATQQETQARLKLYNQWMPHVHADYHEQGVNDPYYFAPAAEPFHEQITDWQREFQNILGANNARYFDEAGWLYFTRERFDLLYPSYGDTYPIYNGAIGMTYEQGGSGRAGLGVITAEGDTLTLADRIDHHLTTSLSTIETTSKNASRVVSEFGRFFQKAQNEPLNTYQNFVIKAGNNPDKLDAVRTLLDTHRIRYSLSTANRRKLSGFSYRSGGEANFQLADGDLLIPAQQPKAVLLQVLFEPKTSLSDSITYDITAWSVPYAYDLDTYALTDDLTAEGKTMTPQFTANSASEPAYAYVTPWESIKDARFLGQLMQQDINVRFATRDFTVDGQSFAAGALVIPRGNNTALGDNFDQTIITLANQEQQALTAVSTGFVTDGFDFGSDVVRYIKPPRIVVATDENVSSYGFGEIWHFFEQELHYPITPVAVRQLENITLSDYNVLILPDGEYQRVLKDVNLVEWVKQGGKLIALEDAVAYLSTLESFGLKTYADEQEQQRIESEQANRHNEQQLAPYASRERRAISNGISGAIFRLRLDNTHPLALGYPDYYYSLKQGSDRYAYLNDGWNVGTLSGREDLISGFVGAGLQSQLSNSMVFGVEEKGKGSIVYLVDNPLFRSFWYNGKLLFANAVFLVGQE